MPIAVIFPLVDPPFSRREGSSGKPFAKVENREVFLRTVEVYTPRNQVAQRIVVTSPDDLGEMQERYSAHLGFQGVAVAGGTSEWFGCVERGLAKLLELEKTGSPICDTLIIHDPCCPAASFMLLDALEDALARNNSAAGVVPVLPARTAFADLHGEPGAGTLSEYVDMAKVFEVQSPQIFRRAEFAAAYAARGNNLFVDDAELLLSAGHKIAAIPGSRFNQRIDSDEMIRLAKNLLDHLPKPKLKTPLNPFGEAEW